MTIPNQFVFEHYNAPTDIEVKFIYRCAVDGCGAEHVEVSKGMFTQLPEARGHGYGMVGLGWKQLWGGWVCPKHKVVINVDDGAFVYQLNSTDGAAE